MTEPTYHHVGLLVPDIEKAVAWFADVLGLHFREPRRVTTHGRIDPHHFGDEEPHDSESYLAWSIDGPPYYELGETRGHGLHSVERHGVGLHHVGVFVDDVDAKIAELKAKGIGTEARMLAPDGTTLVCWTERAPETGLMVEYLAEMMRPAVQGWIEKGSMPVTPSSETAR